VNEKWWRWKKRSEWDEFFKEFDKLGKMVDNLADRPVNDFLENMVKEISQPMRFRLSRIHRI
jgi:hypothetical protein